MCSSYCPPFRDRPSRSLLTLCRRGSPKRDERRKISRFNTRVCGLLTPGGADDRLADIANPTLITTGARAIDTAVVQTPAPAAALCGDKTRPPARHPYPPCSVFETFIKSAQGA